MTDPAPSLAAQIESIYRELQAEQAAWDQAAAAPKDAIKTIQARTEGEMAPWKEQLDALEMAYGTRINAHRARLYSLMVEHEQATGDKTVKIGEDGHVQLAAGREHIFIHPDIEDIHAYLFGLLWSSPLEYARLLPHVRVTFDLGGVLAERDAMPAQVLGALWYERGDPVLRIK